MSTPTTGRASDKKRWRGRVVKLPEELKDIKEDLDLLAAAATPWVQPPSGSAEVKMAALDDHEVRVEAWVTKRTQLGLSAKCYAICIASQCTPGVRWGGLRNGSPAWQFKHLIARLGSASQAGEAGVRPARGVTSIPQARKFLLNELYRHDWQVRALYKFPGTIHSRRDEKSGSCGAIGHRKSAEAWSNYESYLEAKKAASD